jgi:hypothetical protein
MSNKNYPFNPLPWHSAPHDGATDNQLGIYLDEATQRFVAGTRFTRWDGSVFKYGKSLATVLKNGQGAQNNSAPVNIANAATIVVGDRTTILALQSDDGVASNGVMADKELVGGYWVTGHAGATVQNRLIIDTDGVGVSSTGGNITLTFDGPISDAATTPFTEIVLNPYRYLNIATVDANYLSVMGVPACVVTATYWCWVQSWGPCWVRPGGGDTTPGNTINDRTAYFVGDGTVNFGTVIDALSRGHQLAGFCIDQTASGTSALPLIMLQISI